MKNYKDGIILGVLSILCTLLFVGIPVGNNVLEIITILFFAVGLLLITFFGIVKRNSNRTVITSIIYAIILPVLVAIIELQYKDSLRLAIGFLPGLLISITGIILTKSSKEKYKTKVSFTLNIIGLALSLASFLLVIPNGGFILRNY